ncbi:MAG: hypothetical protein EON58_06795 [Alphaproteobacteria bacterium]|nr:MAG: hypothetical protein EON58_06795 [Alphaproteobacteria bacterium]
MGIVRKAIHSGGTITVDSLIEASQFKPKVLQEFFASPWVFNRSPLTAFLSGLTGVSLKEDTTDSRIIKWMTYGMTEKPIYIMAARGTFRVGSDNEIDVADGLIFPGAVLRMEDRHYQLLVKRVLNSKIASSTLLVQVIGNNPNTVVDSRYYERGRSLKMQSAVYGEGSQKGHPGRWSTGDERVNGSTIVRTDKQITGSAQVQGLYLDIAVPGHTDSYTTYLPDVIQDNQSTLGLHLERCEEQGLYGINNVNYGSGTGGGQVYNTDDSGRVVQMGDGLLEQWEQGYTLGYRLTDSPDQIRNKLASMVRMLRMIQDADTIDLNVCGGEGAQYVFSTVMADWLDKNSVQYMVDGNGDRAPVAGLTDIVSTFVTPWGKINFIYCKAFNDRSESGQMLSYNGQVMSADSFDFRFFVRKLGADGRMNIRKYNLEGTSNGRTINRGLVSGFLPGMTGLTTSSNTAAQLDLAKSVVSSFQDSDYFGFLSEFVYIVAVPAECGSLLVERG